MKSKKSAESFAVCIEKYNRVGGDFEQKMSESAQVSRSTGPGAGYLDTLNPGVPLS